MGTSSSSCLAADPVWPQRGHTGIGWGGLR